MQYSDTAGRVCAYHARTATLMARGIVIVAGLCCRSLACHVHELHHAISAAHNLGGIGVVSFSTLKTFDRIDGLASFIRLFFVLRPTIFCRPLTFTRPSMFGMLCTNRAPCGVVSGYIRTQT